MRCPVGNRVMSGGSPGFRSGVRLYIVRAMAIGGWAVVSAPTVCQSVAGSVCVSWRSLSTRSSG